MEKFDSGHRNRWPSGIKRPAMQLINPRDLSTASMDASILLIGIRGTGKTSLAILASASLGFGVVDADHHFNKVTGLSRAKYVSVHGFDMYRKQELYLMRRLLQDHPTRQIIVGGPGFALDTTQLLLETFTMGHPIIFVMRDPREVDSTLDMRDVARVSQIIEASTLRYRSLSSFEFYNLSDAVSAEVTGQLRKHPFLALKHAENDFVRLIHGIRGENALHGLRPLEAQHSLASLPPEAHRRSYALSLPVDIISDIAHDLSRTDFLVDAVQLVISMDCLGGSDYLDPSTATQITRQYYVLRRHVKLPVIVHIERGQLPVPSTSDEQSQMWAAYAQLLHHILRLAPEYVTLDLNCDSESAKSILSKRGSSKIIGDFFDPTTDPAAWVSPSRLDLVRKAAQWDCNLVRFSQQSMRPDDNAAVQCFILEVERSGFGSLPIIAYNTGRAGRGSCCANRILTPVTHPLVKRALSGQADGDNSCMITVQEAQRALYASFTLDRLVFGAFGSADVPSMTPMMHNAAFDFCGMPHEFRKFPSTTLEDIKTVINHNDFGGATIRYPLKEQVLPLVDYLSPEAQAIQAVNTLVPLRRHGLESLVLDRNISGPTVALFGDNTDWIGIYTSVQRNLSPVNAAKRRTSALIIGAGAMARAAVYAMLRLQVDDIFIQNRTLANAESLVRHYDNKAFLLHKADQEEPRRSTTPPEDLLRGMGAPSLGSHTRPASVRAIPSLTEPWPAGAELPTIIVSCIPRFTKDGPVLPDITIPETWLRSPTGGVAVDLAYNLADTPLLRQIRSLSTKVWVGVSGLEVLPEQGFAQFELFTARKAPRFLMRSKLREYISDNI